jgi:glycosyltransferase involved in cell wall biosynthesis
MLDALSEYPEVLTHKDWLCQCGTRLADHNHDFKRKRHDFVAMLRIRNEEAWIREVVLSTFHLCDRVFILDDHSTDGTAMVLEALQRQHPGRVVVFQSPFKGLNESRDKNWLYDQIIRECRPEWILCVDGDEVLEGPAGEAIRKGITEHPEVDAWALKIEFLWNALPKTSDWQKVRVDRIYGDFWRPSLFRPFHEDPARPDSATLLKEFRFQATPFGRHVNGDKPNLHCSSVPQRRIHGFKRIPARLKHYGYMERAWRIAKLDYYTSIDWCNVAEDSYRHMCQGDTPTLAELPRVKKLLDWGTITQADVDFILNVPADAALVHAGPVQLTEWHEGRPWEMSAWAKVQNGF